MERRLSAILAADVVGFSRMVEVDEEGTLARLATLRREVVEATIRDHRGTIFKLMGDGLLAEFSSVVDATKAALAIQRDLAERQSALGSEERIDFRIGLNLGDIVAEGDDFLGDGVNVAARLESLAEPGGILISGTVFDHLKGKVDAHFVSEGTRRLKNISAPVRIYRVVPRTGPSDHPSVGKRALGRSALGARFLGVIALATVAIAVLFWWQPWIGGTSRPPVAQSELITIAVLPFVNVSQDPADEYFADGMTEDLTTDLAKFPDFQVTARTSTAAYKGEALDIRDISRQLAVKYVLEGSVDKGAEAIRVTAQLIDGATGRHLWAERYDRPLADLFVVRDEIRKAIIGAITGYSGPLLEAEMRRAATLPESAVRARDLYYQAFAEFSKFNAGANAKARALLERSIALNPDDASAHALLAWTYFRDNWIGWKQNRDRAAQLALDSAKKAVELEPSNYRAQWSLASAYRLTNDQAAMRQSFERAFALNPNDPDLIADWGEVLRDAGQVEESVAQLERAMQLNPRYPVWYARVLAVSYFLLGRYEDVLRVEGAIIDPDNFHRLLIAAAQGYLGNDEAAKKAIIAIPASQPGLTISDALDEVDWNPGLKSQILAGLDKAGVVK